MEDRQKKILYEISRTNPPPSTLFAWDFKTLPNYGPLNEPSEQAALIIIVFQSIPAERARPHSFEVGPVA